MTTSKSSRETGQSLVEMAISFTFILFLIGGIVDLGMMFYTYVSLRDSAQEGAVYASYDPTNAAAIQKRITASAKFPIDATQISDISISCSGGSCSTTSLTSCQGKPVTVEVRYTYEFIMPILSTIMNSPTWTLDSTITNTILQTGYEHPDACP